MTETPLEVVFFTKNRVISDLVETVEIEVDAFDPGIKDEDFKRNSIQF